MTPATDTAADRAQAYRQLANLIAFPNRQLHEALQASPIEAVDHDGQAIDVPTPYEAYEAEYIRLFEIAPKRPPCPLYEGYWRGRDGTERRELMAELMRFYRFFGLSLGESVREMPDHLAVELEFMAALADGEAALRRDNGDVPSFRRAQRDFLQRHLGHWTPQVHQTIHEIDAHPFFQALMAEIEARIRADLGDMESEPCD
ncbi:MAG: molecular chaperone TorD family protein [Candidatus Bipolaricaulia bacterium]